MPTENKSPKPRVVIDTNVFISGLNFKGTPGEILDLMRSEMIEVFISPFIFEEIKRVLEEDFGWERELIEKTLKMIRDKTIEIQPKIKVLIIKEKEADNRIIECAVEGKAQYIISGDKRHLLSLKEYKGIKILSPAEFLRFL
ncbi:putative toxin-antitoxin system toxin component, PIN family [Candidatus Poribacteria bacterium]|nr:putative toxin-antitoxin system toxin component, PIN family [Candidatus Poribacteria bacterium]